MGDIVFSEEDRGDEIFFITQGGVSMIEKVSYTFLCNLGVNQAFGEIAFFSDLPRTLSATSIDYTDLSVLKKDSFLHLALEFPEDLDLYYKIHDRV